MPAANRVAQARGKSPVELRLEFDAAPSRALLTAAHAGAYLGRSPLTLERWRSIGKGPRFARINGRVGYRKADVEAWVESCVEA